MVKGLRVARVSGMSMTQSSAPLSRNASPPFTCSIGVNCATIVMLALLTRHIVLGTHSPQVCVCPGFARRLAGLAGGDAAMARANST